MKVYVDAGREALTRRALETDGRAAIVVYATREECERLHPGEEPERIEIVWEEVDANR